MSNRKEIVAEMMHNEYEAITKRDHRSISEKNYAWSQDLEILNRICQINWIEEIVANRRRFEGMIVFAKKVVRKAIGWYVKPDVEQQQYFNVVSKRVSNQLHDRVQELEDSLLMKEQQIIELIDQINQLNQQVNQLKNQEK